MSTAALTLEDYIAAKRTLLDTSEAAALLNLNPQTMYKWSSYQNGAIRAVKVGRSVKWKLSDIIALLG